MKNYDYYTINKYIIYIEAINNEISLVKCVSSKGNSNSCTVIEEFIKQLDEYFNKRRTSFDIAYKLDALPFREKLYRYIQNIEYGKTVGAKKLLAKMGLEKGVSVILRATFDNPLLLIIPCHRVVNPLRRIRAYSYENDFREFLLFVEKES